MGDIADMHIEAYQAGLDPNEMDGHDWAEFYGSEDEPDDQEPPTAEEISSTLRCFFMEDMTAAALPDETFQSAVLRLWPNLTPEQARQFENILEAINAFPEE